MLHERCMNINERVRAYKQLRVANDAAEAYQTRLTQIKTDADRLLELMRTREALLRHTIEIEPIGEMVSRVEPRLRDLRDRYDADPSIITPQQALGTIPRDVSQLSSRLQEKLVNAWRAYTETNTIDVPDAFLAIFDQVPEARTTVGRIRTLRQNLSSRRARLPATDTDIASFRTDVEHLKTLVRELEGFPPAVLAFLRAAASGGAEIELLTDEVRQWLTERGMKNAFRIHAR